MGITHVVRGSEYLSSAPKYNLLYESFGWEVPTYVHCSPVMRDAQHKMSKRHGDPSYEDLIAQGYVSPAVVNYVALLGWSPGGEQEIFDLQGLIDAFDIKGVSKSPAVFDIAKLKWMNAEYLKAMTPEAFFQVAEPYLRKAVTNPSIDLHAVAALVQPRCEVLTDLAERVDFLDKLPDYDTALYVHKKSKTTLENSLTTLQAALPVLEKLETWENGAIFEALTALAASMEVKNSVILWPVRVAVSGKQSTPGGATELCELLGKEESLSRIRAGIAKLS
jgi:glutamyl-tRNA synthetase